MAHASPSHPPNYGSAIATPSSSGPGGFSRQPGRPVLEKGDDCTDSLHSPSESRIEQADGKKADSVLKESEEGRADQDVTYLIPCRDEKNKQRMLYLTPENPFEELALQKLEKSQIPMIIEVQIDAVGVGSRQFWRTQNSGLLSISV
jgi:hypothetical protein